MIVKINFIIASGFIQPFINIIWGHPVSLSSVEKQLADITGSNHHFHFSSHHLFSHFFSDMGKNPCRASQDSKIASPYCVNMQIHCFHGYLNRTIKNTLTFCFSGGLWELQLFLTSKAELTGNWRKHLNNCEIYNVSSMSFSPQILRGSPRPWLKMDQVDNSSWQI